jgi:hypothetical protein
MLAAEAETTKDDDKIAMQAIDPSWFESPVQRISTSGGTAPFFKLTLTEKGVEGMASRQKQQSSNTNTNIDKNYWIGKDLSHAEDEKDFYLQTLRIRSMYNNNSGSGSGSGSGNYKINSNSNSNRDLTEGIGLLETFMFDYLGVLRTKTTCESEPNKNESESDENKGKDGHHCNLLVMANMRNNFDVFRMLDLKIGEKTAQAGWKGKSRLRAMKHHLMDGLSNSSSEGYRLAGFNGCPEVFDSMNPLLDILSTDNSKSSEEPTSTTAPATATTTTTTTKNQQQKKTIWGASIDESQQKQAKRFMLNSLNGTGVFRYFFDLHMDGDDDAMNPNANNTVAKDRYLPIEVAEIVSHELMSQLIRLSVACHRVKIPQKWIGSSVALVYDAGFFPDRSSSPSLENDGESDNNDNNTYKINHQEAEIRSKVICRIFDWGRSELLTAEEYDSMTPGDQKDRDHFWKLYKEGVDRLSYNATRVYYHQFAKSTMYSDVTIRVMDFDSMSPDDYIGKVTIALPDPYNTDALKALSESKSYPLEGVISSTFGSTVSCSIVWCDDFPSDSRLLGVWRITIETATNLPPMDFPTKASDPYCMVLGNTTLPDDGQHFVQKTCIKARTLNPVWNETIDLPVCRSRPSNDNDVSFSSLESMLVENGMSSITNKHDLSRFLQWDKSWSFNLFSRKDMNWWTKALIGADRR